MTPPTPEHPPPAPDWILGDDGHWKPPPFTGGPCPRSAPAPGPGPTGEPSDRSTMRGRMGMRRRDIVIGTIGLVIAGVSVLAKVQDIRDLITDIDEARNPTTLVEQACPSTGDVEDIVGEPVTAMTQEPFRSQVGEVSVIGNGCRYGHKIAVGVQSLMTDDIVNLRAAAPPLAVSDPEIGTSSVRIVELLEGQADGEDDGRVVIVFRTAERTQVMVEVDVTLADHAEELAEEVHDRLT